MVGVGGRSKGCKTCRRRRVKCDETKPTCTRCQKAGYECDGYVQFAEFIDVTAQVSHKRPSKRDSTSAASTPCSPSAGRSLSAGGWSLTSSSHSSVIGVPVGSISVNPPWDEQSVFTSHLVNKLFTWHEDSSSRQSAAWIDVLLQGPHDEASLSFSSVNALATAYFAKIHREPDLMKKGAKFYAKALQALQNDLHDPTLAMGNDLLVAIICMAIYEMVAWTQPTSWLHHYRGLAQLTALRGPRRHQSGVALALLPTLRSCITVGYLLERKHCFLESPEWKTLPWAKSGLDAKLPIDELQDLLCDLPGQLEDVDKILTWEKDELSKAALHSALCSRIFATLEALYAWRWKWEQMYPCCTYLVEPGGPDPETLLPIPPNPFTSVIWFTDPYRAQELMTYNTIRLIATRSLETIGVHVGNTMSDRPQSDPLLPMEGTRNEVAVEICRMVDYHLHSLRRSSGAFMLIFPLNVAHLHLDQDSGEIKTWLEAVMAVVADSHGFEVGRRENMPRQLHSSKR